MTLLLHLILSCIQNASANTRLQIVFFFMVCYAPFLKYLWLCINLDCIIPEAASDFPRKSAWKVSQKCNETSPENERKPAPRLKGRNGRTFLFRFHFAHQDGPHSYISRSVCKGKPFCAVKIKVEALPHLVFHKASFNIIPAAKLISQGGVHGDWLYPYAVVSGKLEIGRAHV